MISCVGQRASPIGQRICCVGPRVSYIGSRISCIDRGASYIHISVRGSPVWTCEPGGLLHRLEGLLHRLETQKAPVLVIGLLRWVEDFCIRHGTSYITYRAFCISQGASYISYRPSCIGQGPPVSDRWLSILDRELLFLVRESLISVRGSPRSLSVRWPPASREGSLSRPESILCCLESILSGSQPKGYCGDQRTS